METSSDSEDTKRHRRFSISAERELLTAQREVEKLKSEMHGDPGSGSKGMKSTLEVVVNKLDRIEKTVDHLDKSMNRQFRDVQAALATPRWAYGAVFGLALIVATAILVLAFDKAGLI